MSTFERIVASPFNGLGWVMGQVRNGFDAARNRVQPAATAAKTSGKKAVKAVKATATKTGESVKNGAKKAAASVKATATKTGESVKNGAKKAAASVKAVSMVAATGVKNAAAKTGNGIVNAVKAVGRGVAYTLSLVVDSAVFAVRSVANVLACLFLAAASAVMFGAALVVVAAGCLVMIVSASLNWLIGIVARGLNAVGAFFRGESGLVVAEVLHGVAMCAAFCAAVWALCSIVGLAVPAFAIPVAESVMMANAACVAALVAAGFKVVGFLIEEANTSARVIYTTTQRRVMPLDTYPGVVGFAPSAS